jgi:histidine triad (HIT) family protein
MDCLFCKIVAGEIPARKLYEDDQVFAFHDIGPQAPVRTLKDLEEGDKALIGHMVFTAQQLAREQGCEEGFRLVMNCEALAGQSVFHIHLHVLGQRPLHWPPG